MKTKKIIMDFKPERLPINMKVFNQQVKAVQFDFNNQTVSKKQLINYINKQSKLIKQQKDILVQFTIGYKSNANKLSYRPLGPFEKGGNKYKLPLDYDDELEYLNITSLRIYFVKSI